MRSTLRSYLTNNFTFDYIDINLIKPSKINIRKELGDINGLMASIKANGLLQPITVRICGEYFEVVAGNRRLEACKRLRWATIPCFVKDVDDKTAFELSLIENVQRRTLNPLEEAEAFKQYVDGYGWGGITDLAHKIGKSVEYVSHRLKLLELPKDVQNKLISGQLSPSCAQELLWVEDDDARTQLASTTVELKMSTKELRSAVKLIKSGLSVSEALLDLRENQFKRSEEWEQKVKVLEEAILILRICLVRFDDVVKKAAKYPKLRSMLLKKRYTIHKLIDSVIYEKKRIEKGCG
ncbi:MAG: ParB/RepB/Spo0J family partition protein [Nitrososphaerales archaeon]